MPPKGISFDREEFLRRFLEGHPTGHEVFLGSMRGDLSANPPLEIIDDVGGLCSVCSLRGSCPVPELTDYLEDQGARIIVTKCKSFQPGEEAL